MSYRKPKGDVSWYRHNRQYKRPIAYSTIATDCNGDKYVVDKVYDALEDLYRAIEIYKKSENTYKVYFFVEE